MLQKQIHRFKNFDTESSSGYIFIFVIEKQSCHFLTESSDIDKE